MTQTSIHIEKTFSENWITRKYFYSIDNSDYAIDLIICLENSTESLVKSGLEFASRITIDSSISLVKNKLYFIVEVNTPRNGGRNRKLPNTDSLPS